MPDFQLRSDYSLQGDQGEAVEQIVRGGGPEAPLAEDGAYQP